MPGHTPPRSISAIIPTTDPNNRDGNQPTTHAVSVRPRPENNPVSISTKPITTTQSTQVKGAGRPAKLVMPPLPHMPMSPVEQDLYDFFIAAYHEDYPDLTATDHLLLQLAGYEYIKFLRLISEELESGKLVSMARQHPGVQFRALLDQMSVTRRSRIAHGKPDDDAEGAKEIRDFFMSRPTTKK